MWNLYTAKGSAVQRFKRWLVVLGCLLALAFSTWSAWAWDRFMGNKPIHFYGRVSNAEGEGLPNVLVRATVTIKDYFRLPIMWVDTHAHLEHLTTMTDAQGNFEFSALRAHSIVTMPYKRGWDTPPWQRLPGERSPGVNPNDPHVFCLWPTEQLQVELDRLNHLYQLKKSKSRR